MNKNVMDGKYKELQEKLKIDCKKCSGLCCVALCCMKTDGFPENKEAGVPCKCLESDFHCRMYSQLESKNMRGCLSYECFGAGQKVTQKYSGKIDWKMPSDKEKEILPVFLIIYKLHQMEWYLIESLSFTFNQQLLSQIKGLISENEQMTGQTPHEILHLDLEHYQQRVNRVLKEVIAEIAAVESTQGKTKDFFGKDLKKVNFEGADFSMSCMIATNLEGCNLHYTNFLGADMRDANIRNTDLSECLFLTQMQINSAKGNQNTKLPANLVHPSTWKN